MEGYEEIWNRFVREERLEFGGHTDPQWQSGHALSSSFIVPVEVARFRRRLQPLQEALRPFPFVSLHPDHFMHITLIFMGFLVPRPRERGELSRERLAELEGRARTVLSDFPTFSVRLANLNAFPGAAFVEAHEEEGMLEKLREVLRAGCGLERPPGPAHLTLAYFHAPDGSPLPEELIRTIERYRSWPIGELQVESVEITLLDLKEEYPRPEAVARIPLKKASRQGTAPGDGRE